MSCAPMWIGLSSKAKSLMTVLGGVKNMRESSDRALEIARNTYTSLLQRLRDDTSQTEMARVMGVHKSTVNRLVNEHAENVLAVMALAGMKVVDVDAQLISDQELAALRLLAERGLQTFEGKKAGL